MNAAAPSSSFDMSSEAQSERARRPRSASRAKLAKRFFESTYTAWEEQGDIALRRAAFHDPMGFVNMVARLMPQKIEHTTPTDGMTDDRLAQLLDLAEGMLRLKGSGAHRLDHENGLIDVTPSKGGGGPGRVGDVAGRGSTSTSRDAAEPEPAQEYNKLEVPEGPYNDHTPVTPYISNNAIPHPVGRPFAKSDFAVEHDNKAALNGLEDEIDPASLF